MNKSEQAKRKATGHEGVLTVSTTVFNQTAEERRHIEIRPFATDPARVGVKLGRTINLGNYESARIDVSLDIPCYAEEATGIYKSVLAEVSSLLSEEVEKITKGMTAEQSIEELL